MSWTSFLRLSGLILVAFVADKGIGTVNQRLAEPYQVPQISEMLGLEGTVEALKERGVPMTPPVLIGVLIALALLPKAVALSIPAVKAGTKGSWWLGGVLARGTAKTPAALRFVKDHPKTSAASVATLLVALLTGAAVFHDDVPYANDGIQYAQAFVDNTIEWSRTDVEDGVVKWLLEVGLAIVALMVLVTNRGRLGKLISRTTQQQAPALALALQPAAAPAPAAPRQPTVFEELESEVLRESVKVRAHAIACQVKEVLPSLLREFDDAKRRDRDSQQLARVNARRVSVLNEEVQRKLADLRRACSVIPEGELDQYEEFLEMSQHRLTL